VRVWLAILLISTLFLACSPSGRLSYRHSLDVRPTPPDSIKAKAVFTAVTPQGGREDLSAVLFLVPGQRYRLELSAGFGVSVASLLWKDSAWTLLLPTEESFIRGAGSEIQVPGALMAAVNVHQLAGIFWGDLLPEASAGDSSALPGGRSELLWKGRNGDQYRALIRSDGWVSEVERRRTCDFVLIIRFGDPVPMGGRAIPSSASFARDGQEFLVMKIKTVDSQARWTGSIWKLTVPEEYQTWVPKL